MCVPIEEKLNDTGSKRCSHCYRDLVKGGLCKDCTLLPRCECCEIIFSDLGDVPSKENPLRCKSCLQVEDNIKTECFLCRDEMFNDLARYIEKGNLCSTCVSSVFQATMPENRGGHGLHTGLLIN